MSKLILTEIWIYPIKSLGGIRLATSDVLEKGLRYDRRWMLVDTNNVFITQRAFPVLSQLKVRQLASSFQISFQQENIDLPFVGNPDSISVSADVWGDPVSTVEVSSRHSQWFSERLGIPCKLVSFPEENPRPIDTIYANNHEDVSLADGYPFLILGETSLKDLNNRLSQPVPMNRFRPNLIFAGGEAYTEDTWRNFSIGKNRFLGVKPCGRCVMTTIDQETGDKGVEPLLTLSRFRKKDGNVYFGQNVIAIDHGKIHEGDEINIG